MTHHVTLSGGMDSTAALHRTVTRHGPDDVVAVSFDYKQRHRRELEHAAGIAHHYGIRHHVLPLAGIMAGSALTDTDTPVPHGHYAADNMAATVVNGRNLLFAAAAIATTRPGDTLTLGVHAGDHPIYPDCRPSFVNAVRIAADAYGVTVLAPWLHTTKDGIITAEPDAPYSLTWSCYEGGDLHCGRCGTCVERAEAFHLAGRTDPTTYLDATYWQEVTA